jgi:hypothetical protein
MAIGARDWAPQGKDAGLLIARFTDHLLSEGGGKYDVESVSVKIFGVAKTVVDCFRHRRRVGLSVAIERLQKSLRQRKATPAEIARDAEKCGVSTVIRPYLEALTANA